MVGTMSFRRACSYTASFKTPKPPDTYSAIEVTFQQEEDNLVKNDLTSLRCDDAYVYVELTQEETARFKAGIPAYVQLRCYAGAYDAPGSKCYQLTVWPALADNILPGGE